MDTVTALQHRFFSELMESQYWPTERMLAYQRERLEPLVRHARRNSPFYAERLDVFFTGRSVDWSRWTDIPIVRRSDLASHRHVMLASRFPPAHGPIQVGSTSGSSGVSITISTPGLAHLHADAHRYRANTWHDIDWGLVRLECWGNDATRGAWPEGTIRGPWGPPWDERSRNGYAVEINRMATPAQIVEFLTRAGVTYLRAGAKHAVTLALETKRQGVQIALDVHFNHGEAIELADAALLHDAFSLRTVDLYSSAEAGPIAHPCREQGALHVNAESVLVEILDECGQPVAEGQRGRVVVTPFLSTPQPLIRYDQGDTAIRGAPCRCGRKLPVIKAIDGRKTVIFHHPDGRSRWRIFPEVYRDILDCGLWQIVQTGPLDFEFRYVPRRPGHRGDEATVAYAFRANYFDDANLAFVRLENIPLSTSGKFKEYVAEWRPTQEPVDA
jgi:phenylacetate-CoA ligase